MCCMRVRKLGMWLALLAIALQAAWPLLAAAKPRGVALVPLCTVDGVTHYLEVPTGKPPAGDPALHGDHCAFCLIGAGGLLPSHTDLLVSPSATLQPVASGLQDPRSRSPLRLHGARAPPFLLSMIFDQPHRGNHETAFAAWRHLGDAGITDPGARVLRLGVLHR